METMAMEGDDRLQCFALADGTSVVFDHGSWTWKRYEGHRRDGVELHGGVAGPGVALAHPTAGASVWKELAIRRIQQIREVLKRVLPADALCICGHAYGSNVVDHVCSELHYIGVQRQCAGMPNMNDNEWEGRTTTRQDTAKLKPWEQVVNDRDSTVYILNHVTLRLCRVARTRNAWEKKYVCEDDVEPGMVTWKDAVWEMPQTYFVVADIGCDYTGGDCLELGEEVRIVGKHTTQHDRLPPLRFPLVYVVRVPSSPRVGSGEVVPCPFWCLAPCREESEWRQEPMDYSDCEVKFDDVYVATCVFDPKLEYEPEQVDTCLPLKHGQIVVAAVLRTDLLQEAAAEKRMLYMKCIEDEQHPGTRTGWVPEDCVMKVDILKRTHRRHWWGPGRGTWSLPFLDGNMNDYVLVYRTEEIEDETHAKHVLRVTSGGVNTDDKVREDILARCAEKISPGTKLYWAIHLDKRTGQVGKDCGFLVHPL